MEAAGWRASRDDLDQAGCECAARNGTECACDLWDDNDYDLLVPFARPPLPEAPPDVIAFYIIDNDYEEFTTVDADGSEFRRVFVRLHGITEAGHSVMCDVHGFQPYCYVEFGRAMSFTDLDWIRGFLGDVGRCECSLKEVDGRTSTHGYHEAPVTHLYRVTCNVPSAIRRIRSALLEDQMGVLERRGIPVAGVYEANIDFVLRFGLDKGLVGMDWVYVRRVDVAVRRGAQKAGRAQIEIRASHEDLHPYRPDGMTTDGLPVPPLRLLSYDIECVSDGGHFPNAKTDRVSHICATLYNARTRTRQRVALVLGSCDDVPDTLVMCFATEVGLLRMWAELLRVAQPDVLTGWNIDTFDTPYLIERAETLGCREATRYTRLLRGSAKIRMVKGRKGVKAYPRHRCAGMVTMDMMGTAKQLLYPPLGSYSLNSVSWKVLKQRKDDVHYSELPSLCALSTEGRTIVTRYCTKDADLPLDIMLRKKFLVGQVLMSRVTRTTLRALVEKGQQAKVKCQFLNETLRRGFVMPIVPQDRRDYSGGYVENPIAAYYGVVAEAQSRWKDLVRTSMGGHFRSWRGRALEGVDNVIVVLDFHSLYPSIMIAYNICYSTKLGRTRPTRPDWEENVHYRRAHNGVYFVTAKVREGILPRILKRLLAERGKQKKHMGAAYDRGDPDQGDIHNAMQLALKVSANSIYGFLGAFFYCDRDLSEAVTKSGQFLIQACKNVVETWYRVERGTSPCDAVVVYGDTDSIMIRLAHTLSDSFRIGFEAARLCTRAMGLPPEILHGDRGVLLEHLLALPPEGRQLVPIKLGLEEVYFPFILLAKKKYFGLMYVDKQFWRALKIAAEEGISVEEALLRMVPTFVTKGAETKRRDPCEYTRMVLTHCIDILKGGRALPSEETSRIDYAIEEAQEMIRRLRRGEVPLHLLQLSKGLSKPVDEYEQATPGPHVALTRKIALRNPGSEKRAGDRVYFVIIDDGRSRPDKNVGARAEDPAYAIRHRLPLDYEYYVHQRVLPAVCRLFGSIIGTHTFDHIRYGEWDKARVKKETERVINLNKKQAMDVLCRSGALAVKRTLRRRRMGGPSAGGLGGFLVARPRCVVCGAPLHGGGAKHRCGGPSSTRMIHICRRRECRRRRGERVQTLMTKRRSLVRRRYALGVNCRVCMGAMFGAFTCSNMECEYFYQRMQVCNDIEDVDKDLGKLFASEHPARACGMVYLRSV